MRMDLVVCPAGVGGRLRVRNQKRVPQRIAERQLTAETVRELFFDSLMHSVICSWIGSRSARSSASVERSWIKHAGLLGKRKRHRLLPTSLSFQNELDNLARGAVPRKLASPKVADRCQLGCTICYAYRQSCSPCQRDVRQIVAQVRHLFFGHTCPFHALLECSGLARLPEVQECDF